MQHGKSNRRDFPFLSEISHGQMCPPRTRCFFDTFVNWLATGKISGVSHLLFIGKKKSPSLSAAWELPGRATVRHGAAGEAEKGARRSQQ